MSLTAKSAAALLVVGWCCPPAACLVSAQVPAVNWERLDSGSGDIPYTSTEGLAFRHGLHPDGALDTLYVTNVQGVFRLDPGTSQWTLLCEESRCSADFIVATKEGYLIIGSRAGATSDGVRSTDGGISWERNIIGYSISTFLQSTLPALGGAVFAGNVATLGWSFEGGDPGSWIFGESLGGEPIALAEVQPSTSLPDGRLVGGVWNGAVYSDDGGDTWSPSALFGVGHVIVNSLSFAADTLHPFAGVLYAGVLDANIGYPAVYRSDDGGVNYEFVRAFEPAEYGMADLDWALVKAVSDSSLFVGLEERPGGPESFGFVVATFDGGSTWQRVADSTNGWGGYGVQDMELARDGRLYTGTNAGVWRTADPVVVSRQETVGHPPDFGTLLEVAPNPFAEETDLLLTLDRAARVRLTVFDLLGREVGVLIDRTLPAGQHAINTSPIQIPTGVSFVRAVLSSQPGSKTTVLSRQLIRVY